MNALRRARFTPLVTFGFTFLVSAGAGLAQQPCQAQISAMRQACPADYRSYCASVPTGGPAALECLKEHAQSLSAACRQAVTAISGPVPSAQNPEPAPAAPSQAAPAPVAPAYRVPPPLSPRQEAMLLRRSCGPDFRAYCRGVQPGGGRIIECLEANGPYLSRQCRSALLSARQGR